MSSYIDKLNRWAARERRQTSGPARACTRPYPDRDGPTLKDMDVVRRIAEADAQNVTPINAKRASA